MKTLVCVKNYHLQKQLKGIVKKLNDAKITF